MAVKFVMFKDGSRHDFDLPDGATTLGRREDCGLRVPVSDVSRNHCQITVEGEKVSIKDLGSANGTYVNDQRIGEQSLRPGDLVKVGPCVFTVQINGRPAEIVSPEELAAFDEEDGSGEIASSPPASADSATKSSVPRPPSPPPPPAKPAKPAAAAAAKSVDDDAMEFLEELDLGDLDEADSDSDLGADFSALDDLDLDADDDKK